MGDLMNGQVIDMLNGEGILIEIDSNTGTVTINDNSMVETANVMATNGVIHAIDQVLVPPGLNIAEFLETCSNPPTPSPTTGGAACYDLSIHKCKCDAESCTQALCEAQGPDFYWTDTCPVS